MEFQTSEHQPLTGMLSSNQTLAHFWSPKYVSHYNSVWKYWIIYIQKNAVVQNVVIIITSPLGKQQIKELGFQNISWCKSVTIIKWFYF